MRENICEQIDGGEDDEDGRGVVEDGGCESVRRMVVGRYKENAERRGGGR